MVTLEQIKLLESKIARAIEVVNQLTEENIRLKKRNGELEEIVERLKDEKTKVEAGIVSALDRLNQFEDAIEKGISVVKHRSVSPSAPAAEKPPQATERPQEPPGDQAADVPSAYTVDETEDAAELEEEPGGTELDIF